MERIARTVSLPRVYRFTFLIVSLAWIFGGTEGAAGQNLTGGMQTDGTSYYVFARPGQNTIQVMVVGSGIQTGLYELGEGTDLEQLVVLGGYSPGVRQARNDRTVTVQLYRDNASGQREKVYEASLDALVAAASPAPTLQMGDVAQIEVVDRERFSWRDGLRIVTASASLALLIERLARTF